MLVVADAARREHLRAAVLRLTPDARIETAKSAVDAVLRSAQNQPTDLLVLDVAVDGIVGPALTRHLARIAQSTVVLVFGDATELGSGATGTVWAWNDADLALQRWFNGRRTPGVQGS